jgi:hypothetical protein
METERKRKVGEKRADTVEKEVLNEVTVESEKNKFGRTLWDVLSGAVGMIAKYPATSMIFIALLSAGGVYIAWSNGLTITRDKDGNISVKFEPAKPPTIPIEPSATKKQLDGNELVKRGKEKNLPYVILSITDKCQLELEMVEDKQKLILRRNITYVIRALKKIEKTDNVFVEQYWSSETTPMRVPGSEFEVGQTGGKWTVEIEMEEGETRTITTGAVFPYDLPLKDNRLALGEQIRLSPNEQFFSYPNEGDVVGEIVMKIESRTINLATVGVKAARRYNKDEKALSCDNVVQQQTEGLAKMNSLSARWLNVMPNQEVGINFSMGDLMTRLEVKPTEPKRRAKA